MWLGAGRAGRPVFAGTGPPALKFAAHYAPFATLIPLSGSDVLEPPTRRFMVELEGLTAEQCEALGRRWRLEPEVSRALLQAVANHREARSEESVAMAALTLIPAQVTGDSGWAAVRTAVHGGRVLGSLSDLSPDQVAELLAPIEPVVPFASLTVDNHAAAEAVKAAVSSAIPTIRAPRKRPAAAAPPQGPPPYASTDSYV